MKHEVLRSGIVVGWSDDRRFGGPVEGEILFDKIYFAANGRRIQVGAIKRVGFERTDVYETLSGEAKLVGSVFKDGRVTAADGREVGQVTQDVWSEMTSNTSGAVCLLLGADSDFVTRALGATEPKPQEPVKKTARQSPPMREDTACREDHVFGAGAEEKPAPVTEKSAEVCRYDHVFGSESPEQESEDDSVPEPTESEPAESEPTVTPPSESEGDEPEPLQPVRMPEAEDVFSYGTPKPGKTPKFKPASKEETDQHNRSEQRKKSIIGGIMIVLAVILFILTKVDDCSCTIGGCREDITAETVRYEYSGLSGGGNFGDGGALAGPTVDHGSYFELRADGTYYGVINLSRPTVNKTYSGSYDGDFSDSDIYMTSETRLCVAYQGDAFFVNIYFSRTT